MVVFNSILAIGAVILLAIITGSGEALLSLIGFLVVAGWLTAD
jgi:hypothetical protein